MSSKARPNISLGEENPSSSQQLTGYFVNGKSGTLKKKSVVNANPLKGLKPELQRGLFALFPQIIGHIRYDSLAINDIFLKQIDDATVQNALEAVIQALGKTGDMSVERIREVCSWNSSHTWACSILEILDSISPHFIPIEISEKLLIKVNDLLQATIESQRVQILSPILMELSVWKFELLGQLCALFRDVSTDRKLLCNKVGPILFQPGLGVGTGENEIKSFQFPEEGYISIKARSEKDMSSTPNNCFAASEVLFAIISSSLSLFGDAAAVADIDEIEKKLLSEMQASKQKTNDAAGSRASTLLSSGNPINESNRHLTLKMMGSTSRRNSGDFSNNNSSSNTNGTQLHEPLIIEEEGEAATEDPLKLNLAKGTSPRRFSLTKQPSFQSSPQSSSIPSVEKPLSPEMMEIRKAELRTFYEWKDPAKIEKIDTLFAEYTFEEIAHAVRDRYGILPKGWRGHFSEAPSTTRRQARLSITDLMFPGQEPSYPPILPPPESRPPLPTGNKRPSILGTNKERSDSGDSMQLREHKRTSFPSPLSWLGIGSAPAPSAEGMKEDEPPPPPPEDDPPMMKPLSFRSKPEPPRLPMSLLKPPQAPPLPPSLAAPPVPPNLPIPPPSLSPPPIPPVPRPSLVIPPTESSPAATQERRRVSLIPASMPIKDTAQTLAIPTIAESEDWSDEEDEKTKTEDVNGGENGAEEKKGINLLAKLSVSAKSTNGPPTLPVLTVPSKSAQAAAAAAATSGSTATAANPVASTAASSTAAATKPAPPSTSNGTAKPAAPAAAKSTSTAKPASQPKPTNIVTAPSVAATAQIAPKTPVSPKAAATMAQSSKTAPAQVTKPAASASATTAAPKSTANGTSSASSSTSATKPAAASTSSSTAKPQAASSSSQVTKPAAPTTAKPATSSTVATNSKPVTSSSSSSSTTAKPVAKPVASSASSSKPQSQQPERPVSPTPVRSLSPSPAPNDTKSSAAANVAAQPYQESSPDTTQERKKVNMPSIEREKARAGEVVGLVDYSRKTASSSSATSSTIASIYKPQSQTKSPEIQTRKTATPTSTTPAASKPAATSSSTTKKAEPVTTATKAEPAPTAKVEKKAEMKVEPKADVRSDSKQKETPVVTNSIASIKALLGTSSPMSPFSKSSSSAVASSSSTPSAIQQTFQSESVALSNVLATPQQTNLMNTTQPMEAAPQQNFSSVDYWVPTYHEGYQKYYYYNSLTGESRWDDPGFGHDAQGYNAVNNTAMNTTSQYGYDQQAQYNQQYQYTDYTYDQNQQQQQMQAVQPYAMDYNAAYSQPPPQANLPTVVALYPYMPADPMNTTDLSLNVGDHITVYHQGEDGWWEGFRISDNASGRFPANYVQFV